MDEDKKSDEKTFPPIYVPPLNCRLQVARIIHVKRQTVLHWRKKGLFNEDFVKHGVYLYSGERVMQLKSVYHKAWTLDFLIEATKFFNLLFGKVTRKSFGYLWTKQGDEKIIYSFDVYNPEEREAMARWILRPHKILV